MLLVGCSYSKPIKKPVDTKYIIITNCTARKRRGSDAIAWRQQFLGDDLKETSRRWRRELRAHLPKMRAQDMYVGRSIAEAKWVAEALQAPLFVVSAGLGLINSTDEVAPYDLTASGSQSALHGALRLFGATTPEWWELLCDGRGIFELVLQHPSAIVLAALPANYVEMVSSDLQKCSQAQLSRIRLFTSQPGRRILPASLAGIAMPYDVRLESTPNYAGTQADFPQRAMRHFVECINAHSLPATGACIAVKGALARCKKPQVVDRVRADDAAIKTLLRSQWNATGGRSSILLRYLRDDARVACEQSRFAQLWREIRNEITDVENQDNQK